MARTSIESRTLSHRLSPTRRAIRFCSPGGTAMTHGVVLNVSRIELTTLVPLGCVARRATSSSLPLCARIMSWCRSLRVVRDREVRACVGASAPRVGAPRLGAGATPCHAPMSCTDIRQKRQTERRRQRCRERDDRWCPTDLSTPKIGDTRVRTVDIESACPNRCLHEPIRQKDGELNASHQVVFRRDRLRSGRVGRASSGW